MGRPCIFSYVNVFLPRDATQSAVLSWQVVCPSVRDVDVLCSRRLEFLENNFPADWFRIFALYRPHHEFIAARVARVGSRFYLTLLVREGGVKLCVSLWVTLSLDDTECY